MLLFHSLIFLFYFITERTKKHDGVVLVHCQAGVSRSATIVIAYIMEYSSLSMQKAYDYVKSKRTIVAPNLGFMGQLLELEKQINAGSTEKWKDQLVLDVDAKETKKKKKTKESTEVSSQH